MSFRSPRNQPPVPLSIYPNSQVQPLGLSNTTGASSSDANALHSPRRTPLPLSPTHSAHQAPWLDSRSRSYSLDVPKGDRDLPPLPGKNDKRLPLPPTSPHQTAKGVYAGAYDNKLVTLISSPTGSADCRYRLHYRIFLLCPRYHQRQLE